MEGVAVFQNGDVDGYVLFTQKKGSVLISVNVEGELEEGYHGMLIHD